MRFSFKAMWKYKCPRCRKGDLFKKPFRFTKALDMYSHCQYCNKNFEPEPGFYYGAMFLSYIISSWFILLPTLFLVFYCKWSDTAAFAFAIGLGAVTYFRFLRGSRSLWLHIMSKYDPKVAQEVRDKVLVD